MRLSRSVMFQLCFSHVPVPIHNIHTYHYHNTGYVHVPLGTTSINAYIQDTGLLACFAGWQVSCLETSQTLKKQHFGNLKYHRCHFSNVT